MKTVKVRLKPEKGSGYDVLVGAGLLEQLPKLLPAASKCAVISDSNVAELYGKRAAATLEKNGFDSTLLMFPAGEQNKTLQTAGMLAQQCLESGLDRRSLIVALGGGVTGDLAGFVAATYMRGIPFVQAPTTLLAMVDASIGGKTGVDLPNCKNCVGAFHQPLAVFSDVSALETLPDKELKNGLAESAKHAVMLDGKLFQFMEESAAELLDAGNKAMEELVFRNAAAKAAVVSADEKEGDYRKVLNFGHTVGHALESLAGFRGLGHGEAVAIGMRIEARIAVGKKFFSKKAEERQAELLEKLGLDYALPEYDAATVFRAMATDKKSEKGVVMMALPAAIGRPKSAKGKHSFAVSEKEFEKAWLAGC